MISGHSQLTSLLWRSSKRAISCLIAQREADLVDALEKAVLAERIDLEAVDLVVRADDGLFREVDRDLRARRGAQGGADRRHPAASSRIGSTPFWKQLLKKMSPKLGAMTARKPLSTITVTAFSRDEPQPKLRSATTILASAKPGWLRTKSGLGRPSGSKRRSWNNGLDLRRAACRGSAPG